jgi:hypothetical protein
MANLVSSAVPSRSRAVPYWATTAIIAAELAVGGVWDILRVEYVRAGALAVSRGTRACAGPRGR